MYVPKTSIVILIVAFMINSCSVFQKTEKRAERKDKLAAEVTNKSSVSSKKTSENSTVPPLRQVVEAEDMALKGYQTDNQGSFNYVRLTDSTGAARFIFSLPSGNFDIDVRYLSESIGQNSYVMYIDGNQIIAWLGKDRDNQWHMLSEQRWHVPRNIEINKGDEIRVEALSENGSGVIFDYIEFTKSVPRESQKSVVPSRTIQPEEQTPIEQLLSREDLITIYPEEYDRALKNPLKGFRPSTIHTGSGNRQRNFDPSTYNHEYGLLIKNYFKWNLLENEASDGADKIIEVCDREWRGIEKKNIKIIPRVYIIWPGQEGGWPADMTPGDFTSDQFRDRVLALIKKLGEAWDNDSRVAFIEMGIIGEWGEMEWPDTRNEIKEAMAAQFHESFHNKLVMIRWPNTYDDHIYNFGYYWDSFAHHDQDYCGFHINKTAPKWKTAVIGGETAYNWGNVQIQPGRNPDESLTEAVHRNYIAGKIRKLHANHLGWIADYDQSKEKVRAGAEIIQKVLGYRFVISEVSYPRKIDENTPFIVSFNVKNSGSSPFYYNWPVEVSLLDLETKQPVWKKTCSNLDIRNWMPGDQWDDATGSYKIPAEEYSVTQTFHVPDIPSGEYILALAILDPAGNRPCVRFAIENYFLGGRHPIGKIGVNYTPESFVVSGFDDIKSDNTLSYDRMVN